MAGRLAAWLGRDLFREHFWKRNEVIMQYSVLMSSTLKDLVSEMLAAQKVQSAA